LCVPFQDLVILVLTWSGNCLASLFCIQRAVSAETKASLTKLGSVATSIPFRTAPSTKNGVSRERLAQQTLETSYNLARCNRAGCEDCMNLRTFFHISVEVTSCWIALFQCKAILLGSLDVRGSVARFTHCSNLRRITFAFLRCVVSTVGNRVRVGVCNATLVHDCGNAGKQTSVSEERKRYALNSASSSSLSSSLPPGAGATAAPTGPRALTSTGDPSSVCEERGRYALNFASRCEY